MNRSGIAGISSAGGQLRVKKAMAVAALTVLALGTAAAPGVRGRVTRAITGVFGGHSHPQLKFSDPPTDDELLRVGLFAQPLIPVGPTDPAENKELAKVVIAYSDALYRGERDAVQPLADFVGRHPHSPWTPGLELDLGAVYRQTGHFSKALATWQSAWDRSRDLSTQYGHVVGDLSAAYLSQIEAYLGRKELLAPLLEEVKTRPTRGAAGEILSESARGLAEMEVRPDVSFKCGPSALSRILQDARIPETAASRRVLADAKSTPKGLSLSAVQAISVEAGMDYQMAFRSLGAPVITPAVANWKVGHYAALLGRDARDRVLVSDSTFGEDIAMTQATFDEESSGYFLVPPGPLPQGWRRVEADEGNTVWGRGNTGNNHDNGATGDKEIKAFPPGKCGGCTTWNVEAAVVGLELTDDPVGYKPPVGPEIRFPMTYSHRDVDQPGVFTYTNFGDKWTFDWLSYVVDNPTGAFPGNGQVVGATGSAGSGGSSAGLVFQNYPPSKYATAKVYRRGGGDEPYVFLGLLSSTTQADGTSQPSLEAQFSQSILNRIVSSTGAVSFTRVLPDGTTEKFTLAGQPSRVRLPWNGAFLGHLTRRNGRIGSGGDESA